MILKENIPDDMTCENHCSKNLNYLSRACIATHILIYLSAWAIYITSLYLQHSTPPFRPCFELHDTGILFLLFIVFGSSACGFLFMCSPTKEEWKKSCILWGIIQLSGAQMLSIPVSDFLNWGNDGAEATILFYGGGVIATIVSLIIAVAASYSQEGHPRKIILFLRLVCLFLLIAGSIMSLASIEKL